MKYQPNHAPSQGFSLVEMLIVVSIIGVIAAIAIPNIGSINSAATTAKNQRNAQSVVSVNTAGSAAGVPWLTTNRDTTVGDVIAGRAAGPGAFAGKTFQVPDITGTDLTGIYPYIGVNSDGSLFYDKTGGQPGS